MICIYGGHSSHPLKRVGFLPATEMNLGHKLGRLRNRLARLKKKVPDAGADRQGQMTARIAEIEEILRKTPKPQNPKTPSILQIV